MLGILDDIAKGIVTKAFSAWEQAEAHSLAQAELDSMMDFFVAVGRLKSYRDLDTGQLGGSETDISFIPERVMAQGELDAAEGKWRLVKFTRTYADNRRGSVVEMPQTEAEWLHERGAAVLLNETQAAEWYDREEAGPFVPEVGDQLRIAHLLGSLNGLEG